MANRTLPRLLQAPAVIMLLLWMLVPLGMTLFFSFIRYVLNSLRRPEWTTPSIENWRGLGNYKYVLDAKDFWFAIQNSVFIVVSILIFTVIFGLLIAVLVNRSFPGRGIVRVLLISPFFVMPAVNAVLWINMILDPVLGLNGLAVAGINDLVVGLRELPVIGQFGSGLGSQWPRGCWHQRFGCGSARVSGNWAIFLDVARVKANLFPRQPDLCLCCDNDGHMAVDALCGSYFHDLLAV